MHHIEHRRELDEKAREGEGELTIEGVKLGEERVEAGLTVLDGVDSTRRVLALSAGGIKVDEGRLVRGDEFPQLGDRLAVDELELCLGE